MTTDYRTIIIARLNTLGIAGEELCGQLVEYGAILTGSFVLQCVLDEYYPNSDIDIFIPRERNQDWSVPHELERKLYEKYYGTNGWALPNAYMLSEVLSSRKFIFEPQVEGGCVYRYKKGRNRDKLCGKAIKNNRTKMCTLHASNGKKQNEGVTFNTIIVNTIDLPHYIDTEFDLSFCTTRFDGKNVHVSDDTLRKIGHVIKPHSNVHDMWFDDMKIPKDHYSTFRERLLKYARRGFIIYETPEKCVGCFMRGTAETEIVDPIYMRESRTYEGSDGIQAMCLQFIEKLEAQFLYEPHAVHKIFKLAGIAPTLRINLKTKE